MLKNIMYGAIILCALAIAYNQVFVKFPERPVEQESPTVYADDVYEKEKRVEKEVQEQLKDAEKKQEHFRQLFKKYNSTYDRMSNLKQYLDRDSKRVFRRILHDSLPYYGAELANMQTTLLQIEGELDQAGIPINDSRYEGRRAMR